MRNAPFCSGEQGDEWSRRQCESLTSGQRTEVGQMGNHFERPRKEQKCANYHFAP
jgi:hypothetical protein